MHHTHAETPIRRILVVLHPSLAQTPALDRAVAIACASKATLCLGLFDPGPGFAHDGGAGQSRRRAQRDALSRSLEALALVLQQRTGLDVETIDDREPASAPAIVALAQRHRADLVIKDVGHESTLRRLLFVPLDVDLLRESPIPVWLVAPNRVEPIARIAAAIDTTHPEHGSAELNDAILAMARAVAHADKAVLWVLSAFTGLPYRLGALESERPFQPIENDELYEKLRIEHRAATHALVARHGLSESSATIRYGSPVDELVTASDELRPDVMVIGTMQRRGLERLLLGGTAEKLLTSVACDVLVVPAASVRARAGITAPNRARPPAPAGIGASGRGTVA